MKSGVVENQIGQALVETRRTRLLRMLRAFGRLLWANPNLAFGLLILISVSTIAIVAPLIERYDPIELSVFERMQGPSSDHWFGTDHVGRDVYSRTIHGSRTSLLVASCVVVIVSVAGVLIGLTVGYNRRLDNVIMRVLDGIMAFPTLILALALMALLGSSVQNVIIAICVVDTPRMVRVVRASVLTLRDQEFVEAARAIGAPTSRILLRHITPNTYAPVMVQASLFFAQAIITEASLSFLGAGTPAFIPTWGNIIAHGRKYIQTAIWISLFPGIFLATTVLAVNMAGDALRDILDPRLRGRR